MVDYLSEIVQTATVAVGSGLITGYALKGIMMYESYNGRLYKSLSNLRKAEYGRIIDIFFLLPTPADILFLQKVKRRLNAR